MFEDMREALMKKALGFETDEIVEEYSTDENGNQILVKRKITKKFNPPDVSALKFLSEQNYDDDLAKMTDEDLLKEKDRLLQLLKEKEEQSES